MECNQVIAQREYREEESKWKKRQIKLLEKQLKKYWESVSVFWIKNEEVLENIKLIEKDLSFAILYVHRDFVKAHDQYALAINGWDKKAARQARKLIKFCTDWYSETDLLNYSMEDYSKIKDLIIKPKLMYYVEIKGKKGE